MKITITKGLPASGKSTWAREQCADGKTVRVNKDDLRAMLGGEFSKRKEGLVLAIRDFIATEAHKQGFNVIVDDTNFAPQHIETLTKIAKKEGLDWGVQIFDTDVDTCIERDSKRQNPVGSKVIMDMYRKYVCPLNQEYTYIAGLRKAIIVDIDGTLAHMADRSPYDFSKVLHDSVDTVITDIVYAFSRETDDVIVVSGREDSCREDTTTWLRQAGVRFSALYMRKTGDHRKDSIVKKEIYEEHIKGKYNVRFVLDDRDQVVRMWREQGLKCLQVAEGNF